MKLSSHAVRAMFAFGLEQRTVIAALGNSPQSAVECIATATSSPAENTHKWCQSVGCRL